MYKSLILAFHGCDESVRNKLILNQDAFKKREKPYDYTNILDDEDMKGGC